MTNKRKKGLEFHIKHDDYFGTLATLLNLLMENWSSRGFAKKDEQILLTLIDELMYLQTHYVIHPQSFVLTENIPRQSLGRSENRKMSDEEKFIDMAADQLANIFVAQIDEKNSKRRGSNNKKSTEKHR